MRHFRLGMTSQRQPALLFPAMLLLPPLSPTLFLLMIPIYIFIYVICYSYVTTPILTLYIFIYFMFINQKNIPNPPPPTSPCLQVERQRVGDVEQKLRHRREVKQSRLEATQRRCV